MGNERVLLVDDEQDFVQALSERLEIRGIVVEVVNKGPAAIEKARNRQFDAIVLDLAMPGMDGIETLQGLREIDPNIQVILLTGRATLQKGIQAMKLGAMDFLEKPVKLDVLLEKIRTAKSKSDAAAEKKTQHLIQDILKTKGW
jgi:DNA-binding NtrC family response regulator